MSIGHRGLARAVSIDKLENVSWRDTRTVQSGVRHL